jgi:hypothetical protein
MNNGSNPILLKVRKEYFFIKLNEIIVERKTIIS